jgi:transposase
MPCRKSNPGKYLINFGQRLSRFCRGTIRVPGGGANTCGGPAVGASALRRAISSRPSCMCCAQVANGRPCPKFSAAPVRSIRIFNGGGRKDSLCGCGERDWQNMTRWKGLCGGGRAWMGRRVKPHWHKRRWETTRQIGEKKGTKRSLLVDGRGAPLSLIVAGANRHDVKLLGATLDAIVVERPKPTARKPQHLCVDKGYTGKPAEKEMRDRGYIPHVPTKGAPQTRHRIQGKARRWVVERTHSWMNNYRKLKVRYEKKAANFEGLLHLATALICWRM